MKKMISIVLAILLVTISGLTVFSAGTPTVTVLSATAAPGDVVELEVVMENNPGINTFSFSVDYDDTALELTDVTINESMGGQFVYKKKAVWLNGRDTQYNGNILTLEFKVTDDAPSGETEINLTYSSGDISNYNEDDINFNVIPGVITIENENGIESNSFLQKIIEFFNKIFSFIKALFN